MTNGVDFTRKWTMLEEHRTDINAGMLGFILLSVSLLLLCSEHSVLIIQGTSPEELMT